MCGYQGVQVSGCKHALVTLIPPAVCLPYAAPHSQMHGQALHTKSAKTIGVGVTKDVTISATTLSRSCVPCLLCSSPSSPPWGSCGGVPIMLMGEVLGEVLGEVK